jgi:predicted ATPase
VSARAPLGIIVDDLHWLDDASSGLLHYIARVTNGSRIAIACATRNGELSDNPAALRLVRTLRREGRLLQLDLAPLDEAAVAELVRSTFDLDGARVFRESGGNPLFAIEVARSFATGLRSDETPSDGPRALEALLEERLDRLDGRARDVVVWAAALGREFDPQLLV